jgi:hypothetical protein
MPDLRIAPATERDVPQILESQATVSGLRMVYDRVCESLATPV